MRCRWCAADVPYFDAGLRQRWCWLFHFSRDDVAAMTFHYYFLIDWLSISLISLLSITPMHFRFRVIIRLMISFISSLPPDFIFVASLADVLSLRLISISISLIFGNDVSRLPLMMMIDVDYFISFFISIIYYADAAFISSLSMPLLWIMMRLLISFDDDASLSLSLIISSFSLFFDYFRWYFFHFHYFRSFFSFSDDCVFGWLLMIFASMISLIFGGLLFSQGFSSFHFDWLIAIFGASSLITFFDDYAGNICASLWLFL